MNDEKKTYSVVGTVTIGADEYRDLIEEVTAAKAEADRWRNKFWEIQRERDNLKTAVIAQQKNNDTLRKFINGDAERSEAYRQYCITLYMAQEGDDE